MVKHLVFDREECPSVFINTFGRGHLIKFVKTVVKISGVVGAIYWISATAWAANLEDFAGGVSNTRVTINPATVGLIDRFHVQFVVAGNTDASTKATKTDRELSTFADQFTLDGEPAAILAPDESTPISAIQYEEARLSIFNLVFIYPLEEFSVGIESDNQRQIYSNGFFLHPSGTPLTDSTNETDAEESFVWDTFSYMAGIAFKPFSLGIRYNIRTFDHAITSFNPSALINSSLVPANFSGTIDIVGQARYATIDYGILLPNLLPKLDIGLTYRTPAEATVRFDQDKLSNLPLGATYENREFEEPSLIILGLGYIFEFGGVAFQVLGDVGRYSETQNHATGDSGSNGGRSGGLFRFVWSPLIDLSYGVQEEQLAGFTLQKISTSLQFPMPFLEGYNLKLGTQTIRILSGQDTIIDITLATFSFNLQFGERRGRALEVAPKTKEIRFIDRL